MAAAELKGVATQKDNPLDDNKLFRSNAHETLWFSLDPFTHLSSTSFHGIIYQVRYYLLGVMVIEFDL